MTLKLNLYSLARCGFSAVMALCLAACGGGSESDGPSSAVADAEAARIGTLYRYAQSLGSVMLTGLTEVGVGNRRAGTRSCTFGGSVTYTDTTPNPAADPQATISFSGCQEAIGTIQGSMQVKNLLVRLNEEGAGTFNVAWSANLTVDGYSMSFESVSGTVIRSATGSVQIETYGAKDNALQLTAPDGRSVQFSDARIAVSHDPATGAANFGGSDVQMRSVSTADLNALLRTASLSAPATAGASGVVSIGLPQSGSLNYRRSFDETATDLVGAGTTSGGLLNLTIDSLPAKYGFPGSAGQYVWSSLLANPGFSLPSAAP